MSVAMTISEAKQMQADDVALDGAAVRQAEAEATEAEESAATLERSAVEGGKGSAAPAAVIEQRAVAEFARTRAGRIRAAANRAKAARRLLALGDLGHDVEQLAATMSKPDASIEAVVQRIADAHAELVKLCQDHDTAVIGLIARARQLGAEKSGPIGPLATSAHVAVTGNGINARSGIQSGSTTVLRIDQRNVSEAVQAAVTGDPGRAIRILAGAKTTAKPKQAPHYFMGTGGHVVTSIHPIPPAFAEQIRRSVLRELSPDEVTAHLAGRLHGHQA